MVCRVHAQHSYPTEREHAEADKQADEDVEAAQAAAGPEVSTEEADAWLAEIDEALAENGATSEMAQLFVAAYLQKGGQ